MQGVVKRKLIVPTATRWNSNYDAVVRVTNNSLAESNELCTKLELWCFSEFFLKECDTLLKPLSNGLDILQGEENCFLGTLLPTLETIIKKVIALQADLSSMTIGLAGAIEDAIGHRFEKVFNAILAAVTLPKFKLKWVEFQMQKELYKQMLIREMRPFAADNEVIIVQSSQE